MQISSAIFLFPTEAEPEDYYSLGNIETLQHFFFTTDSKILISLCIYDKMQTLNKLQIVPAREMSRPTRPHAQCELP